MLGRFALDTEEDHVVAVKDDVAFFGQPVQVAHDGHLLLARPWGGLTFGGGLGHDGRRNGFHQLGDVDAGLGLDRVHDGGDALAEDDTGINGARLDAADEHLATAALEEFQATTLQAVGDLLRQLKEVLLGLLDVAAQHAAEAGGELLAGDGGVHDGLTRLNHGAVGVVGAEVRFKLSAGAEAERLCPFGRHILQIDPAGAFALLLLPLVDELGRRLGADAAAIFFKGQAAVACDVQALEGGLEAVVARWTEHFAAHAADGDGGEDALGLFQLDLLFAIQFGEGFGVLQQVAGGFFSGLEQRAIARHLEQADEAFSLALHLHAMALGTGEHETGGVEQAEGAALRLHMLRKHLQSFVFWFDGDLQAGRQWRSAWLFSTGRAIIATRAAFEVATAAWATRAAAATTVSSRAARARATTALGAACTTAITITAGFVIIVGKLARRRSFGGTEITDPFGHEAQTGQVECARGGGL